MRSRRRKLEARDAGPTTAADHFQLLVNGVAEVLALAKPDGTFVFVSDSARDLYGHDPAELIGTQALDLVDPVDRAEAGRRLAELLATEGNEQRMVVRLTRGDGGRVWADTTARLIRSPESGEPLITIVAREATDRIEAQTALSRVEARFRELLEWLPAIVYEAEPGPDGRFLYVSPQIQEVLGYTPDEWLARPSLWRESIHPDELETVLKDERQQEQISRETDRRIASEYRMVDRARRTVWVRDVARLSGLDENPFWRGVMVDITAERSAHLALADAHERHRGMVDALPACSYRAERRAMGHWHFVSAQIQSLLGYSPAEWCANPTLWRASLHVDDRSGSSSRSRSR